MKKRTIKPKSNIKHSIGSKHIYVLICFASLLSQYGSSRADEFWIIENPSALAIYDVYEQRLSDLKKSELHAYSSWQIIEDEQTLSDQFTPVIKVAYKHRTYFFQRSNDGTLSGETGAGKIEKYKDVQTLNDTVRVINDDRLSLRRDSTIYPLTKGTLLHRIFQHTKKIYVNNLSDQISGWIESGAKQNWELYHADRNERELEERLFLQIDQIFQSYNTRLDRLFNYLNKRNQQNLPAPKWEKITSLTYLSYQIDPAIYRESLQGLRQYLFQELNDLLYGSNYVVKEEKAQIIITKSEK